MVGKGQAFGLKIASTDRKRIIGKKKTSTEYLSVVVLFPFFTLTSTLFLCILNILKH